ncbi:MAG: hypothetical protein JWO60_966 [Frankiales bacterium]|nr:hypothetical protein [Frankiales bacterium]
MLGALAYLLVALLSQVRALGDLSGRTQPDGDVPQTDWFLGWTPHALSAGRNPLYTDALNVPDGVNLTWNTLLPLPGLLAAPITATLGVTAAHTVLLVVGFTGSMLAMRWCALAFTSREPTAWLAGLAYGCSPFVVAQAAGHLNLMLAFVPPLLTRVLHELYTGRTPWRRAGLRLALLAVVQFLITVEVLASMAVMAAAGTAVLLLRHRRDVSRTGVRPVVAGLALGAVVSLAVVSVPLGYQLVGPGVVHGAANEPVSFAADALGLLVPSRAQLLHGDQAAGWGGNTTENGSFLGPVVVLLVAWSAYRYRGPVRDWAAVAVTAWVLSLGGFLRVGGHPTPVKLPFLAVWKVPLLESLIPVRFSLYALGATVLCLVCASEHWSVPRTVRRRLLAGLAAASAVVPLLPAWPYPYVERDLPAYFTDGGYEEFPAGCLLETYPVSRHYYGSRSSSPMAWQSAARYHYRTPGGYVITPGPDGRGTFSGGETAWERAQRAVQQGRGPLSPAELEAVRRDWERLGVDGVVVDQAASRAGQVNRLVFALTGRTADRVAQGVAVWRLDRGGAGSAG